MKKLLNGIVEFQETLRPAYIEKFVQLALGQAPDALFIGCSDSRVVPNLFASTDPGDLFVIRNVGNLIPPYTHQIDGHIPHDSESAALEFGLKNLPIKNIIVCGHSECGAMHALLHSGADETTCTGRWLKHGLLALDKLHTKQNYLSESPVEPHNQLSQLNVLQQIDHILTYPFIQEQVQAGNLKIHGWWFDLHHADVHTYDTVLKKFIRIDYHSIEKIQSQIDNSSH